LVFHGPIRRGCVLSAFICRSGAIARRSGPIARRSGAIIRRLLTIVCCYESLFLSLHRPSRLGRIVLRLGTGVPCVSHLRALIRRDVSRHRGPQTGLSMLLSEMRRMLTMHTARVAGPLIRPGGGFLIAGGLILVRSCLVAVRSGSVAV
jgi:hypothetical protein